jgi:hypothetical protein
MIITEMIIKDIKYTLALFVLLMCSGYSVAYAFSDAKMTIQVVDEEGTPVEAARVGIGFLELVTWSSSKEISIVGHTDKHGQFIGTARTDNYIGFNVTKDGYYLSVGDFKFTEEKYGRWEPWNPEVHVVLRKVVHPVPMYARNAMKTRIEMPVVNRVVGFDLIEFDWMTPYGKGKNADIYFKLEKRYASEKDFDGTLTITFSNRFDGMQVVKQNRSFGSQLKLARFAPDNGYEQKFVFKKSWLPGKPIIETYAEDNNYYFRVRSEERNGKLVRAMYGKIIGDIRFDPRDGNTAAIYFTYYLNPDYSKNLEFSGQNLFNNLKEREQVIIQ